MRIARRHPHAQFFISVLCFATSACPIDGAPDGGNVDPVDAGPNSDGGVDGDQCDNATVFVFDAITTRVTAQTDPSLAADDVFLSCGFVDAQTPQGDVFYRLQLDQASGVEIRVRGPQSAVSVFDGDTCLERMTEQGCTAGSFLGDTDAVLTVPLAQAGDVLVAVEGSGQQFIDIRTTLGGICLGDAVDQNLSARPADDLDKNLGIDVGLPNLDSRRFDFLQFVAPINRELNAENDPDPISLTLCPSKNDQYRFGHMGGLLFIDVQAIAATPAAGVSRAQLPDDDTLRAFWENATVSVARLDVGDDGLPRIGAVVAEAEIVDAQNNQNTSLPNGFADLDAGPLGISLRIAEDLPRGEYVLIIGAPAFPAFAGLGIDYRLIINHACVPDAVDAIDQNLDDQTRNRFPPLHIASPRLTDAPVFASGVPSRLSSRLSPTLCAADVDQFPVVANFAGKHSLRITASIGSMLTSAEADIFAQATQENLQNDLQDAVNDALQDILEDLENALATSSTMPFVVDIFDDAGNPISIKNQEIHVLGADLQNNDGAARLPQSSQFLQIEMQVDVDLSSISALGNTPNFAFYNVTVRLQDALNEQLQQEIPFFVHYDVAFSGSEALPHRDLCPVVELPFLSENTPYFEILTTVEQQNRIEDACGTQNDPNGDVLTQFTLPTESDLLLSIDDVLGILDFFPPTVSATLYRIDETEWNEQTCTPASALSAVGLANDPATPACTHTRDLRIDPRQTGEHAETLFTALPAGTYLLVVSENQDQTQNEDGERLFNNAGSIFALSLQTAPHQNHEICDEAPRLSLPSANNPENNQVDLVVSIGAQDDNQLNIQPACDASSSTGADRVFRLEPDTDLDLEIIASSTAESSIVPIVSLYEGDCFPSLFAPNITCSEGFFTDVPPTARITSTLQAGHVYFLWVDTTTGQADGEISLTLKAKQ